MSGFEGMVSLRPAQPAALPTADASLGSVASATLSETLVSNPSVAYYREKYLENAYALSPDTVDATTARERLAREGIEGRLQIPDQGIPRFALDTLIDRKKEEIQRQEVLAHAPPGVVSGSVKLGVALGGSLLDPLNIAAGFFPVVGEARYAQLLGKSAGILRRTAVRAAVGAAEGTTGTAAIEPLVYSSKRADQADYDMGDSITNIAFGGVFGAGLHAIGGATGDLWRYSFRSAGDIASRVQPETRAAALKTAVAQSASGERVNVEPFVNLDPLATPPEIPYAENLSATDRGIESRFRSQISQNVDAAIVDYAKIPESDGGRILNTDLARELSPEYQADRTRSAAVHEPASFVVKEMYARKLKEAPREGQDPLVVFTAGGTGAGKTTAIADLSQASETVRRAQIVYDTNLNSLKSSAQKIDQALDAGKTVSILYVSRDPVDALVKGALPRAMRMGRTVPLVEHANTHVGSARVIGELKRRYASDNRVEIQVIDNTHGKGNARLGSIDEVPKPEYNALVGELHAALETEHAAGRISDAVHQGTLADSGVQVERGIPRGEPQDGPSGGRQPEPPDARRPISLKAVHEAASAPKLSTVADERASAVADRALAESPPTDTLEAAQEQLTEELARLKEAGGDVDFSEELAPYDEAIKDAETYSRAARAAVICGMRHA